MDGIQVTEREALIWLIGRYSFDKLSCWIDLVPIEQQALRRLHCLLRII